MSFCEQVVVECLLLGGLLVGVLGSIGAPTENARALCVLLVILCTAGYCLHVVRVGQRGRQ